MDQRNTINYSCLRPIEYFTPLMEKHYGDNKRYNGDEHTNSLGIKGNAISKIRLFMRYESQTHRLCRKGVKIFAIVATRSKTTCNMVSTTFIS